MQASHFSVDDCLRFLAVLKLTMTVKIVAWIRFPIRLPL